MDVSGLILACVDTDASALESWNRWYDLEHLPPNIALPGVLSGRRYVAPPELHEVRLPEKPLAGFEAGRGTNLTLYTLCGDPEEAIAEMTRVREELEAAGRMVGAGHRVVRAGDALTWNWGVADPALRADSRDIPHIQHTSVRVVLRRGGDQDVRTEVAPAAVEVAGVHGVLGHRALFQQGTDCDLYLMSGDPASVTREVREAARYPDGVELLLDAPFQLIVPFDYSFVARIRDSWLPQTID